MPTMFCCQTEDVSRRQSKALDKEISSWMDKYQKTMKFLLLGAGESGKTTILKQMKILHIKGFSEAERNEKTENVRNNILEAIKELTGNMMHLKPPQQLEDPENEESFNFIQNISLTEKYDFPQEFYDHVIKLWADAGVQKCYYRSCEFPLIDSAKYFLNKVHLIRKDDYVASDDDILHCRKRTSEIQRIEFEVKVPKKYGGGYQEFWMFDVGGQRGERRKWIQVFDGINAILFLVASSGFDLKLREDHQTNRLQESLSIFQDVWRSRFLREAGFILFLNKQDILEEKINRGVRMEEYFPEYKTYKQADADGATEYHKARCFVRDLFLAETKRTVTPTSGSHSRTRESDAYEYDRRNSKHRDCYWHFTTATDTKNVKRVFEDIHNMILMQRLDSIGLS